MAVVSMSKREFSRLEILLQVQSGRLRVADACEPIGLHRRQVFRLRRGLKQDGATSLLSKRRGKPGNNRLPSEVRTPQRNASNKSGGSQQGAEIDDDGKSPHGWQLLRAVRQVARRKIM